MAIAIVAARTFGTASATARMFVGFVGFVGFFRVVFVQIFVSVFVAEMQLFRLRIGHFGDVKRRDFIAFLAFHNVAFYRVEIGRRAKKRKVGKPTGRRAPSRVGGVSNASPNRNKLRGRITFRALYVKTVKRKNAPSATNVATPERSKGGIVGAFVFILRASAFLESGAKQNFRKNFPKLFAKLSRNFPETFPKLSRNFPATFPQLSRNFPATFPKLSRNFPETFPKLSRNFPETFPKLSRNFPETLATPPSRRAPT